MLMRATLSDIIPKLRRLSSVKEVEQTQAIIIKAGLYTHPYILANLIPFSALSPLGSLAHAQAMFQETKMDDAFICNTMIRAYTNSVFPIKAIYIYNHMQHVNAGSDHVTYTFTLKACARASRCEEEGGGCNEFGVTRKGAEIHGRVLKLGFHRDAYIQNSLVYMYSRCGFVGLARQVFDEMTERSVASWNIMIMAYHQINDFKSADCLIELMPEKNVVSWNTLIGRHVRSGNIEAARKVFREMPERDAVSWNSMIAGYVQVKNYAGALALFDEMQIAEVEATEVTLISVLGACAETGALEMGRKIHESLKEKSYKIEGYLGNALVDTYTKCGNLSLAWEVFNELKMKPVSCWNAMIMGLAVHGYCQQALELLAAMELRLDGIRPNRVTFIGVLIACSHQGLVEEGRQHFNRMIKVYKIMPDIKHYGCMVDLLSRWGLLYDAWQMIKTMPLPPTAVLWRTLLGACRVHSNAELAEESFRQLAKLEVLCDGDYVLLSNIYAESERWDDVQRVRNAMIHVGIPKKLGSSNIEIRQ
ncbi:pentatricopeptide repeat-containing protein At3g29230-like [Corylus avellana]|uniref:pentatricopeptide repeat-containing protein At3g29230-like n=1 Tax=Corylus avellana TaxID=13451 RepID=UPI001E204339|nr:pentatricopeptide repeat-containing protein At3g29230-like [Corylus avellana]